MARQRLWVGPFTQLFCLSSIVDHSLLIVSPKFISFCVPTFLPFSAYAKSLPSFVV
jgi:hypothetical protein